MKIDKVDITVGTSIYNTYKDINVPLENPFKEFIDNSTQSYYDNKDKLEKTKGFKNLVIKINTLKDSIIIQDNAYGMNVEDFDRALKLGAKKEHYTEKSRSQFGMGLKYAAMYLGDVVTIESTELGSINKYRATLDSEELAKNINIINRETTRISESEHYTRIEIKKLRHKYTQKKIEELKAKLAKIYRYDLENGVEIIINDNQKLTYIGSEIRLHPDTGTELIEFFNEEFEFEGKKYNYVGWIGILNKASVSDAGLSLLQHNRLIRSNYRPYEIFKKSNSYQYQRIIGEIALDNWPVVFNKIDFNWDNGLEERFIGHLATNKKVSLISKIAQELRYSDIPEKNKKQIDKATKENNQIFSVLKESKKTAMPNIEVSENETKAYLQALKVDASTPVSFEGVDYRFEFSYESYDQDDWLRVENIDRSNNTYRIIINPEMKIFKIIKKEADRIQFLHALSTIFSLAQLSSISSGFKDSHKFINKVNEIIRLLGYGNE